MHPITEKIDAAVEKLEAGGMDVTPQTVLVNVEKEVTWADWSSIDAAREALMFRIRRRLKAKGKIIADEATGLRRDYWQASRSDLEEQYRIKEQSSDYDLTWLKADRAVLDFLKGKEAELGYEPYTGLFQTEIDRIYSMHGLTPPGAKEEV